MQSNTQQNNSDDRGSGGIVIPKGQTSKHYHSMFAQALVQAHPRAEQAQSHIKNARALSRMREAAFWNRFLKPKDTPHVKELSPGEKYQQYLKNLEQTETTAISRLSTTESIDTRHMADAPTVLWPNFAEQMGLVEIERSPISTSAKLHVTNKLDMPIVSPIRRQPKQFIYYKSDDCALGNLIETGVILYMRDHERRAPSLIELSPTAHSLVAIIDDWQEEGYPGTSGRIPIVANPQLEVSAVRCWGN